MDIKVMFPIDGDMLNEYDGEVKDGALVVQVRVQAPPGSKLKVNGMPASSASNSLYAAAVPLSGYENTITIEETTSGWQERIVVYWLKHATNKYRLSLDDNIWFLRDIYENRHRYTSIFDNPFLAFLKELHDIYGTKIHANVYYQTEGFNLAEMPDQYKAEWQAHSEWLKLTFHAWQNDPGKPYQFAGAEQILGDCERVTEQIIRFAGEEVLAPVTTIHWGEATKEGCQALRQFGFRSLMGFFKFDPNGEPLVSYYLDRDQIEHVNQRDFWKDHSVDIVFGKIDLVLDRVRHEEVIPELSRLLDRPHEAGFLEMMIHEQYFYSHYKNYQPDYKDKLRTAIRWLTEHGYEPGFVSECVLGNR